MTDSVASGGADAVIAAGTQGTVKLADLVLEGGGVKGIGLAGAVLALDEAGYRFQRVAGTSAGAIAAAIIAALNRAGQPVSKLYDYLQTVQYEQFMAKSRLRAALGGLADAEHLLLHMGIYDGDYLLDWLGGVLKEIGVVYFGDLKMSDAEVDSNWTAAQCYSLVVHVSDISRGKLVRLPWDYEQYGIDADHERIADAVRASMSIPFFFEPVRVRVSGSPAGVGPAGLERVTWVDGGVLDNFPVDVFDRTDGAPSRWPTIGIKLSARTVSIESVHGTDDVVAEAVACLRTVLENADRFYVPPAEAARTIFVDNGGVKATDFNLTVTKQQMLFANGQSAARDWMAAIAQLSS